MILLSTAYFGNIEYYGKLLGRDKCVIEMSENYVKQSYRNRCEILGANGVISLSIPVVKQHNQKVCTRDVEIDYSTNWQHQHWRSITSAYSNSPFFEHYADYLAPYFSQKERYLVIFNNLIQNKIFELLNVSPHIQHSVEYSSYLDQYSKDYRNSISPKKRLNCNKEPYVAKEYYQVFSDRMPFYPNLSILDLLFCEGPESKKYIK